MLEQFLETISALGPAEVKNVLTSAGNSMLKNYKELNEWKNMIVESGEFFINEEQEENSFFDDLKLVLSSENLSRIAKDMKSEDGYDLKQRLYESLMCLMRKYEIPYEYAETYTIKIIYVLLEQLRSLNPTKYEHYFLKDWREEQEKSVSELKNRIEKMSNDLAIFNQEHLSIWSSGEMDINLRRSTQNPSIGIQFFIVDDEHFQDEFEDLRTHELVFIRGRNREETIYCILNELWRLNEKRPIYVVKNLESWNKLQGLDNEGNIYIPWFYADEIVAIENNTNIFAIDENTPIFNKSVLELRPRTRETISRCLHSAGMEYDKAYELLEDTHGLYIQMKKQLFRGEYLQRPSWIDGVSNKAKKTCLLIGCWEEIDGDKLIIESLYGDSYEHFLDEILPYTKGEDAFIHLIDRNGKKQYYLASAVNTWSYLDVLLSEPIWQTFVTAVFEVVNESENLFSYDDKDRLIALVKGESLFWSETIRRGMLKTLLIKGAYKNDIETQIVLDKIVEDLLKCVKTEKQWIYISKFWRELCEISPGAVLNRLENEWKENTGLLDLFRNQSGDLFFGRNAYIDILWGVEQFLLQKDYFWQAFRWLLKIDSYNFDYKSNSIEDIFSKVYCTWMNFSVLQTAKDKMAAIQAALDIDYDNTWKYLYSAVDSNGRSIFGDLSAPKYREHENTKSTTVKELHEAYNGYFEILLKHMDFSVDRWKKIIDLSEELPNDLLPEVLDQLLYETGQMSDEEVMRIKNKIRSLIYRHRYYASADWSMPEEKILEYEKVLDAINIDKPEYEYSYLFMNNEDYPLLHPVPYDQDRQEEVNKANTQKLIQDKLIEFQKCGYNIMTLAEICSQDDHNSLGRYLAEYWNDGAWDFALFMKLLTVQESGGIATDYLYSVGDKESLPYELIIENMLMNDCSDKIMANVYRIEAYKSKNTPLVANAPEQVKKEFWKTSIVCDESNSFWALKECKRYSSLDVYLNQLHQIHYRTPLSAQQIFECFDNIESMPHSNGNQMTRYHVEQLISILQNEFINNMEKCIRISQLEIKFMKLLDWKNMKCFRHIIKQSPEVLAQIVAVVFKKDHTTTEDQQKNQEYFHNMYVLYDKAKFCPAENNGVVAEDELEQWIEEYRQLLRRNDQESIFSSTLGRLLSFSPLGIDNHEPCEAVRKMIEKYGDDKMISHYQTAVYNRRGVFSPSAGKEELDMAESFKLNARYLEPLYPKTASIFRGLYENYKRESDRERMDAENGWY